MAVLEIKSMVHAQRLERQPDPAPPGNPPRQPQGSSPGPSPGPSLTLAPGSHSRFHPALPLCLSAYPERTRNTTSDSVFTRSSFFSKFVSVTDRQTETD